MATTNNPIFEELKRLIAAIEKSPGERIVREIEAVKSSLRLVKRNYDELIKTLRTLEREDVIPILWNIENRSVQREAREVVTTKLHNFLASAFSLVDHFRRHRLHLYANHSFNEEIEFSLHNMVLSHYHHRIAQGLRGYCLHYSLAPVSSSLRFWKDQSVQSAYRINRQELLKWDGWTSGSSKVIGRMTDDIRLLEFATEYFHQIESFYSWLWERQGEIHKQEIDEANILRDQAGSIYKRLYPGDPRLKLKDPQ